MKRVGENCAGCNRWRPSFARTCAQCGLPSLRAQVENLGAFLSGERGGTRPERRVSTVYHGPEQGISYATLSKLRRKARHGEA